MGFKINDGLGKGVDAGVNARNELETHSRILTHTADQSLNFGTVYMLATDFIALTTTASFSGIFFLRNDSTTTNVFIHQIRSSGTVAQEWRLIKQPTGGDVVTDETAADINNTNFKAGSTFDGVVYKGADAKTLTGGVLLGDWNNDVGHSEDHFGGLVILGPGDALGMLCKPGAAGDVSVSATITQEPI